MTITGLSTVVITGTFENLLTGLPSAGTVRFAMNGRLVNTTTNQIVVPQPFTAVLDVHGSFSLVVPATDDPDFLPTDRFWQVTEFIDGASRTYAIDLPASPATQDLAQIAPIDPTSPGVIYQLAGFGSIPDGSKGDVVVTGSGTVWTLPTVNSNVGTFGDGSNVSQVTVDGKGRVTAAVNVPITGSGISALTGDVTASGTGSVAATIAAGAVTNSKQANMAQATFKMRAAGAGTGAPIDGTATQAKTALAIANTDVSGLGTLSTQNGTFSGMSSGTNTGDQTITLTGDVTGSGTGSFATTLKNTGPGATGPSGSATVVPVVTIDAQGRVTALSSATIAIPESAVTNLTTDLAAKAPLASPVFTGNPTAPTPTAGDNDTSIATTAYVTDAITTAVVGLLDYRGTFNASTNLFPATGGSGLAGAVLKGDFWVCSVQGTLGGTVARPGDLIVALTDTPAQTASNWDVVEHDLGYAPEDVANKSTDGTFASNSDTLYPSQKAAKTYADTGLALKANLASPTFTGTPAAPTAAQGTNTTQIATTAMVHSEAVLLAPLASPTFTGTPAAPTAAQGTNTTQLATTAMVHSEAVLLAPLASPALTGNPTATTQSAGNNSTRLATTAYADALVSDTAYAGTWDAVTGISPSKNAVYDQIQLLAPLASPTFTGNPLAPTASVGDNDTSVATTAFVYGERAPRVTAITSNANPTFNTDTCDVVNITAQAAAVASMTTNMSGTFAAFQKLIVRIKDDGTARAITWGTNFEACGVALPTTTVISKRLTVGFLYSTVTSKWGCVASVVEA